MYWEQRAWANWLQLEDKNTTFFHKYASMWKRTNTINRLDTDDGKEIFEESEINKTATKYFQNLFLSNRVGNLSHLLTGIDNSISLDINIALLAKYTTEEVFFAVKGMGPTKASGYDGFSALFF